MMALAPGKTKIEKTVPSFQRAGYDENRRRQKVFQCRKYACRINNQT